jgi:LysM repeat protein
VGLLLAACTRAANPTTLPPSDTPGGAAAGPNLNDGQNATMNAISTEVSNQLTATALAQGGGGEGTVIAPPTNTTAPDGGLPTNTPPVINVATATPIPPATTAPQPGTPCANPYTVKQGDWIYKIARDCGVSAAAIIAANPGIDPNALKPGQLLNMPSGTSATPAPGVTQAACSGTHTVVSGDTLYRLAYNCGLTVEQLAAANGITFPYTIYVGQVLTYP